MEIDLDNDCSVSPLVQGTKRRGTARACAECRRCSRVFPCGNCVKKACDAICPDVLSRFVFANTEDLHDKISQLATRVRQLEDALAHSHRNSSSQPHPLLSDELLQIKMPLEQKRTDGAHTKEKQPDTNDTFDGMGSLSISEHGRSTFFGQAANSWNEQGSDEEEKPPGSDLTIPSSIPSDVPWLSLTFPFTPTPMNRDAVRNNIISLLPDRSSAQQLSQQYFQHAAWMYNPISKADFFDMVFRPIYNSNSGFPVIRSHYLAIMFMVLAIGALLDTDRPAHSQEATQYYELGKAALVVDSVFEDQSISAIQALLLISHYMFLEDIEGPRWAMMGLVVKMAQSVNRDGAKWNLDSDETLRRRSAKSVHVISSISSQNYLQSLMYGRPPFFASAHINTEKPFPKTKNVHGEVEMSFASWKHSFCSECLSVVMKQAFGARPPSYKTIRDMDKKVRTYYVPPSFQISGFGKTPIRQEFDQPMIHLIFQRYIAFSIREITLFYLHRGFFARALEDSPNDPMGSKYSLSILAAYTSACSFVSLTDSMFRQYPVLTERMWFLFTHVFSCSIVLGSVACKVQMAIAPSALFHLDMAHKLFVSTTKSSRTAKILPIMNKLRERAYAALTGLASAGSPTVECEEDELAALGGTTRLVPRKPSSAPSTLSYSGSSMESDPASPSSIPNTISEQTPYPSPEQMTTWQYPINQDYVEQMEYDGQYSNPQLQHEFSLMDGITDSYFDYPNSQYYWHKYDNTFNGGISNVGDYNLPDCQ
ncbi:hypothetical protein EV360DRAFT_97010 [Lentinula raphanica]|nr:hypothetical protein EV360DRAFT_97010 [Lentinula raphanica]